ncbi:MAG: hypothetical protein A2X67_04290 [Ignavibacteria bacterium GWA2_55_11]|nr:MAG: hypothetical protein A2X67_04290 [Ignavibacteria bacterium GWA2_55_11]
MASLRFEWDEGKQAANVRQHGVSFVEAASAFTDENAIVIHDPDHSDDEDRFVLLGMSAKLRVLVVCHCYRMNDDCVRLISARKAAKREQHQYFERGKQ